MLGAKRNQKLQGPETVLFFVPCQEKNVEALAKAKSAPPPLTGGGWGVGEGAPCRYHGNFPPTLTLPRQGGGNVFDVCKSLHRKSFM